MLGSLWTDEHSNNSFFREDDPTHPINPTHTNRVLRDAFAQRGVELNTVDAGRGVDFELHSEGRSLPLPNSRAFSSRALLRLGWPESDVTWVETGTFLGETAGMLAAHAKAVYTIEAGREALWASGSALGERTQDSGHAWPV